MTSIHVHIRYSKTLLVVPFEKTDVCVYVYVSAGTLTRVAQRSYLQLGRVIIFLRKMQLSAFVTYSYFVALFQSLYRYRTFITF